MSYRIEPFINKLRNCGLHHYPTLPKAAQRIANLRFNGKKLATDADYNPDSDTDTDTESDTTPDEFAQGQDQFIFAYKSNVEALVLIDTVPTSRAIYVDFIYLERTEHMVHIISMISQRFKYMKFIIIDAVPHKRFTQDGDFSEYDKAADVYAPMLRDAFHKTLNVYTYKPKSNPYDAQSDIYLFRRCPSPPTHADAVLRNCIMHFTPKRKPTYSEPHKHHQYITINADEGTMVIQLEPPLLFPADVSDESVYMECCGGTIHLNDTWYKGAGPRLNKLRYYMEDDNPRYGVPIPSSMCILQYLTLPMASHEELFTNKPDHYPTEMNDFRQYARNVKAYLDGMARRIQRMWRRAISDPNHTMCKRRLFREFGEFTTTSRK